MERADPVQLASSIGPLNLLLLFAGVLVFLLGKPRRQLLLTVSATSLLGVLLLIGIFPQEWYRGSQVALQPHRYYVFYSVVVVLCMGALGSWINSRSRTNEWRRSGRWAAFGSALLLAQLVVDGLFVRRMRQQGATIAATYRAAIWIEMRSPPPATVFIDVRYARELESLFDAILAPRTLHIAEPYDAEEASETAERPGPTYLLTDHQHQDFTKVEAEFEHGDQKAWVISIR
jgi:hypothetical protein